jgi:hypothetical protein
MKTRQSAESSQGVGLKFNFCLVHLKGRADPGRRGLARNDVTQKYPEIGWFLVGEFGEFGQLIPLAI